MTGTAAPKQLTHRQVMVVLSGLLLGMFLAALDQTIVATSLRTIADDLQGQSEQAWVTTAYLITSTVTTPLYGKLSDSYGRKPFYVFAIVVFLVGSLLCGIAGSVYELAAYRAVQGVGAGGLLSLAFAVIGDLVSPRERGRYTGWFMSVFAISSVLGPVLGGALAGQETLLGTDGWRWIFLVNVPVGLVALVVVLRNLQLPRRHSTARIDYAGAALLTASVVPLLLLVEQGREWGWTSALSLGTATTVLAAFAGFLLVERRQGDDAIIPLRIFSSRVFTLSTLASFLVGIAMFGALTSLPLYLQIVKDQTPTAAGLLLTPLMLGIIVTGVVSGRVMARTGRYKVFPVVGTITLVVAMLLASRLGVDTPLWQAAIPLVVLGAGLGLSMQMLVIAAQNALPGKDIGVATSSVIFFRSMGGTMGAAVFLSLLFGRLAGSIQDRAVAAGLPDAVVQRFGDAAALDDTTIIATLPEAVRRAVLEGYADSMSTVYLLAAVLLLPAVLVTARIKEIPLRTQGALAADPPAGSEPATTATSATV